MFAYAAIIFYSNLEADEIDADVFFGGWRSQVLLHSMSSTYSDFVSNATLVLLTWQ